MKTSCVVLTCDKHYMDAAAFLVAQIRAFNLARYDVFIASDSPLSERLISLGAQHLPIVTTELMRQLPTNSRLKHFAYWRFSAISLLAQEYTRILYLDTDIFCAAPGIDQLFEMPMSGKALAAVLDVHHQYRPEREVPEFIGANLDHARYFNSGVLLIDGVEWRSKECDAKISAICENHANLLSRHDQSVLNLLFHSDWLELSPVWNWQYSKKNAYLATHAGPRLVHYMGSSKLWSDSAVGKNRSHWLVFGHGKDRLNAEENADLRPLHWSFLISALWYRRASLRYLGRFEHDFHTLCHGT